MFKELKKGATKHQQLCVKRAEEWMKTPAYTDSSHPEHRLAVERVKQALEAGRFGDNAARDDS